MSQSVKAGGRGRGLQKVGISENTCSKRQIQSPILQEATDQASFVHGWNKARLLLLEDMR